MKIGLFIPCYVNALYPEVGVATYKLLTSLGLDVDYPLHQTCCGQPMANAGFESMAQSLATSLDQLFAPYDYVVAPSASCAAFVKINYPHVLQGQHACMTSRKIMDVVEFLHDVVKPTSLPGRFPHVVSLHNSCHGVRELGLSAPSERNITPYSKIKAQSPEFFTSSLKSRTCSPSSKTSPYANLSDLTSVAALAACSPSRSPTCR